MYARTYWHIFVMMESRIHLADWCVSDTSCHMCHELSSYICHELIFVMMESRIHPADWCVSDTSCHMCHELTSYICHELMSYVTRTADWCVSDTSPWFICVTWLIHVCGMTHLSTWLDLLQGAMVCCTVLHCVVFRGAIVWRACFHTCDTNTYMCVCADYFRKL